MNEIPKELLLSVGAALLWCVSLLLLSLPLDAEQGLILLYEGLCATLLFLVLPNRLFGGKRLAAEKPEAAIRLWPQAWPTTGRASYSTSRATEGPSPVFSTPRKPVG